MRVTQRRRPLRSKNRERASIHFDEAVDAAVAELVTEPIAKPVVEPVAEPVAEPVTEPIADPVTEPVAEVIAAPVTEPVAEHVTEPVATDTPTDGALGKIVKVEPRGKYLKKAKNDEAKDGEATNEADKEDEKSNAGDINANAACDDAVHTARLLRLMGPQ